MGKKALIFILTYNHKDTIVSVLDRIPKEIKNSCAEILVADDESADNTAELALEYKKKHKLNKLTVIRHKENKGYGGNQKFGYNYAIEKNYDIVVMVHGDGQYAPEEIPKLIDPLENDKADFVFGSRISGKPLKGGMPLYKFLGNKFLTTIENIFLRTNLSEFHSGFRLYSTKALKEIPFNKLSDDYYFDSEIILQLVLARKRIAEKPIPTYYGNEISYVNSIPYGLSILKMLGEYLLHKNRLKKSYKFDIRDFKQMPKKPHEKIRYGYFPSEY
jgi:glycosyltransferase involved in cell wall biosynthesis